MWRTGGRSTFNIQHSTFNIPPFGARHGARDYSPNPCHRGDHFLALPRYPSPPMRLRRLLALLLAFAFLSCARQPAPLQVTPPPVAAAPLATPPPPPPAAAPAPA